MAFAFCHLESLCGWVEKMAGTEQRNMGYAGFGRNHWFNSKELALISALSSLWIVSEIYLGPVISQITQVHGVVQRALGWLLMLTLAALTGRFGRVATMAFIVSTATRIIRPGQIYSLFVGFGYALGGLAFDLLYFFPIAKNLNGKAERVYLLSISLFSGAIALIPYLLFNLSVLGFHNFIIWFPFYTPNMVKSVALNVFGTLIGISILPRIQVWAPKIKYSKVPL